MPTTFANTIDGNEILAKRSQCDYAGADIQTTYATKSEVTTGLASKQDTISDLATIRSGAADGATAVQPGDLSTVATTGAYSDLTGTPTIPTATSDLTNDSGFITLSDVPAQVNSDWNASSGAAEILNKPSIPSATSDLTNDSGFITLSDVPAQVQADWTEADTSDPSYIQNKPSIPSATSDLTNDSGFITLSDVPAQVNADWNSSSGASEILNKPTIPSGTQLVPSATSADANKVLTVDAQGIPGWAAGGSGGNNVYMATSTTTFPELWQAFHEDGKIVYCTSGSASSLSTPYFLQTLKANDSSHTTGSATFVQFNRYSTGRIEAYHSTVWFNSNNPTLGTVTFTRQTIVPDNPSSHDGEFLSANSSGNMVFASVNQVPASTSSDADKVLTVNAQGTPGWATAQAPISAGDGIDITNNVVSADVAAPLAINTDDEIWLKTGRGLDTQAGLQSDELEVRLSGTGGLMYDSNDDDGLAIQLAQYSGLEVQMNNGVQEGLNVLVDGTTIDKNASGELTVIGGGGGGTQADWTEDDPADPSYIENKPTPKTLTGGTNITVTENSSTITISATWQNAQADWTESDPTQPAYIQHKPTLSTVATSGLYSDLSGTPTIPTVDQTYDDTSANAQSGVAVASAISAAVIPISIVSTLPASPDPNTLYVITGA